MPYDSTNGIPDPDQPGHWLVPPWPAETTFSGVVHHFLTRTPWHGTKTAHWLAYYEGYQAALDAVPTGEPGDPIHRQWREDMRDCVARCLKVYRERAAVARAS